MGEAAPVPRSWAHEVRHQAAAAIDALGIVAAEARGLFLHPGQLAVGFLLVVVLEVDGIQRLDQRQVQDRQVDRRLVALVAMIVPGIVRSQHHVAGSEDDVLALNTGEVP